MNTAAAPHPSRLRFVVRGMLLCAALLAALQIWCAWQVYRYAQLPPQPDTHADAAVVLGAAAWDKQPSPVFRERINHALTLYQGGYVDKLIFTGGTPKSGFMTEAEVARRFAVKQGIPERDIILDPRSKDTFQNLANTRVLMQQHDLHSVLIVSDPYHMARALAIARDFGIQAAPSPTPTSRYLTAPLKTQLHFFAEESWRLFAYRILSAYHRVLTRLHR